MKSAVSSLFADATRPTFPQILVLCFNRTLVPYISNLIRQCFDARKPKSDWVLPVSSLKVMNIDRYAYWLTRQAETEYDRGNVSKTVADLLKAGVPDRGTSGMRSSTRARTRSGLVSPGSVAHR